MSEYTTIRVVLSLLGLALMIILLVAFSVSCT
jgi:hypothetical protein